MRNPLEKIGGLDFQHAAKRDHDLGRNTLQALLEAKEARGADARQGRQDMEGAPSLHAPLSQTGADESVDWIRIGHHRQSSRLASMEPAPMKCQAAQLKAPGFVDKPAVLPPQNPKFPALAPCTGRPAGFRANSFREDKLKFQKNSKFSKGNHGQ
jgi:hypothetical protein